MDEFIGERNTYTCVSVKLYMCLERWILLDSANLNSLITPKTCLYFYLAKPFFIYTTMLKQNPAIFQLSCFKKNGILNTKFINDS